jgi:hypothetical protein
MCAIVLILAQAWHSGGDGIFHLYVMSADGSYRTPLTFARRDFMPHYDIFIGFTMS